MYPRIGTNNPRTDPDWIDKKLMNNQETSAEDSAALKRQLDATTATLNALNMPVRKGDIKAAQEQERKLRETFQGLSTEDKQHMYNLLNSKHGLADKFQYRLATAQRERLLKTLNPDHVTSEKAAAKMKAAAEAERAQRAAKTSELNAGGVSRQQELNNKLP